MTADPWALLREARNLIHTTLYIDALREWARESDDGEPSLDDSLRHLRAAIDAALAERQDSATPVVESKVWWWQDKVIRAIINGRHVTIQTNAPNHWFWSVAFVDRKDRYGMFSGKTESAPPRPRPVAQRPRRRRGCDD